MGNERISKQEIEEKKEFLKGYRKAKKAAKRLTLTLEEVEAAYMYPKALTLSDMPKATGNLSDLSDYMVRYEEAFNKALMATNRQLETLTEIEKEIDELDDEEEKMVLELKYIKGMEWEDLSKEMGVSRSTATRLHGKALVNLKITESKGA